MVVSAHYTSVKLIFCQVEKIFFSVIIDLSPKDYVNYRSVNNVFLRHASLLDESTFYVQRR